MGVACWDVVAERFGGWDGEDFVVFCVDHAHILCAAEEQRDIADLKSEFLIDFYRMCTE